MYYETNFELIGQCYELAQLKVQILPWFIVVLMFGMVAYHFFSQRANGRDSSGSLIFASMAFVLLVIYIILPYSYHLWTQQYICELAQSFVSEKPLTLIGSTIFEYIVYVAVIYIIGEIISRRRKNINKKRKK